MTKLTKELRREVHAPLHGDLAIRITAEGIYTKPADRTRTWYGPIGYGAIHMLGVGRAVEGGIPKARKRRRGI